MGGRRRPRRTENGRRAPLHADGTARVHEPGLPKAELNRKPESYTDAPRERLTGAYKNSLAFREKSPSTVGSVSGNPRRMPRLLVVGDRSGGDAAIEERTRGRDMTT